MNSRISRFTRNLLVGASTLAASWGASAQQQGLNDGFTALIEFPNALYQNATAAGLPAEIPSEPGVVLMPQTVEGSEPVIPVRVTAFIRQGDAPDGAWGLWQEGVDGDGLTFKILGLNDSDNTSSPDYFNLDYVGDGVFEALVPAGNLTSQNMYIAYVTDLADGGNSDDNRTTGFFLAKEAMFKAAMLPTVSGAAESFALAYAVATLFDQSEGRVEQYPGISELLVTSGEFDPGDDAYPFTPFAIGPAVIPAPTEDEPGGEDPGPADSLPSFACLAAETAEACVTRVLTECQADFEASIEATEPVYDNCAAAVAALFANPEPEPEPGPPVAVVSGPDQAAVQEIVSFTPTVSDSDTDPADLTCSYDFGDGDTISDVNCQDAQDHAYAAAGPYTVTLTASDGSSQSTDTHQINIYEGPAAATCELVVGLQGTNKTDGNSDPVPANSSVAVPATMQFVALIDNVVGDNTYSYTFDYGDNGVPDPGTSGNSATTSPDKAYDNVGHIVASVIVTNSAGECGRAELPFTMTNTITVEEAPAQRELEAKLTASTQEGKAPLAVTFNATSTVAARDAEGEIIPIVSRVISFEMGGTAVAIQDDGQGIYAIDHAYAEKGTYTATLTVTDEAGTEDTASVQIEVLDPRTNTALLNVTPSTGKVGETFTFDGTDTIIVDGFTVTAWELNTAEDDVDGNDIVYNLDESDDGTTPVWSHVYGTAGEYSPSLTVTYDDNSTSMTKGLTQSKAFVKVHVLAKDTDGADPSPVPTAAPTPLPTVVPTVAPTAVPTQAPVDNTPRVSRKGSGSMGLGLMIFAALGLGLRRRRTA